jgi:hypothetical protein
MGGREGGRIGDREGMLLSEIRWNEERGVRTQRKNRHATFMFCITP